MIGNGQKTTLSKTTKFINHSQPKQYSKGHVKNTRRKQHIDSWSTVVFFTIQTELTLRAVLEQSVSQLSEGLHHSAEHNYFKS